MDSAEQPVVWDPAGPSPSEDSERALLEWARARGVRLVSGVRATAAPTLEVDLAAGSTIEADLARARDALNAQDVDRVERHLATAEATLTAHAELPHGHW